MYYDNANVSTYLNHPLYYGTLHIYNAVLATHDFCRCGPLVRNWCMRYEAKHKYFKKTAQNLGNFTNIGKTVATRHQRYMCYKMTCSTNFLGADIAYGTGIQLHNYVIYF